MKKLLKKLNASEELVDWAGDKSWKEIYETCHRGDWLLWLFSQTNPDDLRELTLSGGNCANSIRHLMKDETSISLIDESIEFGEGKITELELVRGEIYASYSDSAVAASVFSCIASAACFLNPELTADICRKYLPIGIWNINSKQKPMKDEKPSKRSDEIQFIEMVVSQLYDKSMGSKLSMYEGIWIKQGREILDKHNKSNN